MTTTLDSRTKVAQRSFSFDETDVEIVVCEEEYSGNFRTLSARLLVAKITLPSGKTLRQSDREKPISQPTTDHIASFLNYLKHMSSSPVHTSGSMSASA